MIRIGVCDDDALARGLIASAVDRSPDLQVVVACASGEEALDVQEHVDIWLMDMRMPGITGRQACRILTTRVPATKVLLLTAFGDDLVRETLSAGASGYLFKDGRPESLIVAVHAAAAGFSVSSTEAMTSALERTSPRLVLPPELESDDIDELIIEQLLSGVGYADIAEAVHMSESGLKKRVAVLMRRLGVKSRPSLTAKLHALRP